MWGDKGYGPCRHGHMSEFRTLEDCTHDRWHRSQVEIDRDSQTEEAPKDPRRTWSAKSPEPQERRVFQVRAAKALQLAGDGEGVTVGLDTPRWRGTRLSIEMPSQEGRGRRSMCSKMARAEFYGPRWHRKLRGSGGSSQVINHEALRKYMS